MQDLAPLLLASPELIPPRMVEFDTHFAEVQRLGKEVAEQKRVDGRIPWYSKLDWASMELKSYWEELRGIILTEEAWGDASTVRPLGSQISAGCGNEAAIIDLFGQTFDCVTVNGFFLSIRPQGVKNWYLRPLTILKARGVAHALEWCLYILGDEGLPDVGRMFMKVYAEGDIVPDYVFLFDLMAC